MRCPRCKVAIGDALPEGRPPGGPSPEKGAAFCPSCGAPLRLSEEPSPRPLDAPVSLDRRGVPPAPDAAGPGKRSGSAPRAPERPAAPTLRTELAEVERSHWELGKLLGAESRSVAKQDPRAPTGTGPETWPERRPRPEPPAAPRAPAPATTARDASPPPAPRPAPPPAPFREAPPAAEGELPDADTGPVEVRLRRAEGWRRAAAWGVDVLPFAAAGLAALRWAAGQAAVPPGAPGPDGPLDLAASEPAIVLSIAAAVAIALAVYETLAHFLAGATLGKRLLRIRLVGPDGARPSLGRSAARSAASLVSAGLLGLGFLLALFTRSGRSLHDFVARTWVVRAP